MGFIRSAGGMVVAELISADISAALEAAVRENITLFDTVLVDDLTVRFRVTRLDYRLLTAMCKRRGDKLKLLRRTGIYWAAKRLLKRPVLLVGMLLLMTFALYLPGRVLFVRVEGNGKVPERLILAAAEECGICFGASRREVRSEQMKNALLEAVPSLRWAGINTYGCVAVISVSERTDMQTGQSINSTSSILACRDGVIVSATATRGNLLCREGQVVRMGEVLISGYNDCGIYIQAVYAKGEVFAQTNREISAVTPRNYMRRSNLTETKRNYSVIFGKKRINLWKDSGISEGSCVRMYEEYYITLPGGFSLPVCIAVEEYRSYALTDTGMTEDVSQTLLTDFSGDHLLQQMVAGKVLSQQTVITPDDSVYRMTGSYVCIEMIGTIRREEIGE